ncbi:MAG: hypothetical protein HQL44_15285 [Alphaproteobacteria bacterium]|nr:hypothetical protein [Alphaproteobacteria bacterium]
MKPKSKLAPNETSIKLREARIRKLLDRAKLLKSVNKTAERKLLQRMKFICGHLVIRSMRLDPKLRNCVRDILLAEQFAWFDRDPAVELMKACYGDPATLEINPPPSNDNDDPTPLPSPAPEPTGPSGVSGGVAVKV